VPPCAPIAAGSLADRHPGQGTSHDPGATAGASSNPQPAGDVRRFARLPKQHADRGRLQTLGESRSLGLRLRALRLRSGCCHRPVGAVEKGRGLGIDNLQ
jgi:hypothetical protein